MPEQYPLVRVITRRLEHPMGSAYLETLVCGHMFRAGRTKANRRRCFQCPPNSPNWPVCP